MNNLFLLLYIWLHPHHQSITEIQYDEDQLLFEISISLIAHDVEQVMTKLSGREFSLSNTEDSIFVNEQLEEYAERNLILSIGTSKIGMDYLGYESDKDELIIYLESEMIDLLPVNLTIENSMLMETFSEQQNIVHFIYDDLRVSRKLDFMNRSFQVGIE